MKRNLLSLAVFLPLFLVPAFPGRAVPPRKPLIGITSVFKPPKKGSTQAYTMVNFHYIQAVVDAGGVPVVLPTVEDKACLKRYVEVLEGLVLVGGADIPPSAYGEKPDKTVRVMPGERFRFENALIPLWLKSGKPVLGICLGAQFTNVVSGGTLIQDIPKEVGDKVPHRAGKKGTWHQIRIETGSLLARILGKRVVKVYSHHHQAVEKVGRNLRVIARSADGVVEALQRVKGGFGLFVQFHPEQMKDPVRKKIFSALVRAAGRK